MCATSTATPRYHLAGIRKSLVLSWNRTVTTRGDAMKDYTKLRDILPTIFAHLHGKDLLATVLTCRAFVEPGLDRLWHTMDSLAPLVTCLPSDLVEKRSTVDVIVSSQSLTFQPRVLTLFRGSRAYRRKKTWIGISEFMHTASAKSTFPTRDLRSTRRPCTLCIWSPSGSWERYLLSPENSPGRLTHWKIMMPSLSRSPDSRTYPSSSGSMCPHWTLLSIR